MSHNTFIQTRVKSLSALRQAAEKLGFVSLGPGLTKSFYANAGVQAAERFSLSGCVYTLGAVERRIDGETYYELVGDMMYGGSRSIESAAGPGCNKLIQDASVIAATEQATLDGYFVAEERLENGDVVLTCTLYGE